MQILLIATEESHILLRLVNGSRQTVDSIKDCIGRIFAEIFCGKLDLDAFDQRTCSRKGVLPCALQDIIGNVGDQYQLRTKNWFLHKKGCEDKRDPQAAFNVLDSMLKDSLERLKMMRESIPWAHIGISGFTFEAVYAQHVSSIRALCLEGKLGAAIWLRNKMIRNGVIPDVLTHNYLVNGLCKSGELKKANWLVREMLYWGPIPNCATYNTLMKGYCFINDVDRALDLLSTMGNCGIIPKSRGGLSLGIILSRRRWETIIPQMGQLTFDEHGF